jgi:hypothetical protein
VVRRIEAGLKLLDRPILFLEWGQILIFSAGIGREKIKI